MPSLEWFIIAPSSRIAGLCHSVVRGEPYNTCSVGCAYCYARWYRGPHGEPRPLWSSLRLIRAMKKVREKLGAVIPVRIATLSDPFQPIEKHAKTTLRLLQKALANDIPVILNTRLPPPGREWWETLQELAERGLLIMQITITGLQDTWPTLKKLEPHSPPPEERLHIAGTASDHGIPVAVRLQPLIPGIGDQDPKEYVKHIKQAGAQLLILEFLRVEWHILKTLTHQIPESPIYRVDWEPYANQANIAHPPLPYRLETTAQYSNHAKAMGIAFQTCKEGLFHLHHPKTMDCCGFRLLQAPWARRPHLWDLYRIAETKGHATIHDLQNRCNENPELICGNKLSKLPPWLRRPLRLHEKRLYRIIERPQLLEKLAPSLTYDPNTNSYRKRFPD